MPLNNEWQDWNECTWHLFQLIKFSHKLLSILAPLSGRYIDESQVSTMTFLTLFHYSTTKKQVMSKNIAWQIKAI